MSFSDHFSANSDNYARHRPRYPDALFAWLAEIAPAREHAVDLATGSGQAATGLATHFARVSAFDASAAQVAAAEARPNIRYGVAPAEDTPVPDASVDLLTVAQAMHWFDLGRFQADVRRQLRPGGVLAVWTYNLLTISPEVDRLVHRLYHEDLGRYWPAERRHVEDGYATLPFPFPLQAAPAFAMEAEWDVQHLLGYLRSWSAWQRCLAEGHQDPLDGLKAPLREAFGAGERRVTWPLTLKVGRAPV